MSEKKIDTRQRNRIFAILTRIGKKNDKVYRAEICLALSDRRTCSLKGLSWNEAQRFISGLLRTYPVKQTAKKQEEITKPPNPSYCYKQNEDQRATISAIIFERGLSDREVLDLSRQFGRVDSVDELTYFQSQNLIEAML